MLLRSTDMIMYSVEIELRLLNNGLFSIVYVVEMNTFSTIRFWKQNKHIYSFSTSIFSIVKHWQKHFRRKEFRLKNMWLENMLNARFELEFSRLVTFSREKFRHKSYITPLAKGIIVGVYITFAP